METLQGTVERITFRSEDSGYTVLKLADAAGRESACVGVMPTLEPGEMVSLNGSWERHAKFGSQFSVSSYEIRHPTTLAGISRLLCSGFIPHVGPTRAAQIIETFGIKTLEILDTEPQRLIEVSGIGKKTLNKIMGSWAEQRQVRTLVVWLGEFGVTVTMAYRIFRQYGAQAQAKISADPYVLVTDVWGIGFVRADALAQKLGFEKHSYKRIRAGLVHVLREASGEGHCFLPVAEVIVRGAQLLDVNTEEVQFSLDHAVQMRLVVLEGARAYLPLYYHAERETGDMLLERCRSGSANEAPEGFTRWLESYMGRTGWEADPLQFRAIVQAVSSRVFLLTGGPGTGKTTTLQAIVSWFRERNAAVTLAAPTGRAALRMGTVAGLSASTIHRLLEYRPGGGGMAFGRNRDNKLDTAVLVLDEVSMVDIVLMKHLLAAVPDDARLVIVGDSNQLPSVGPGNVLADMITSGRIGHVELKTVFRQAARSRIVTCAHEIISGRLPHIANHPDEDCFFLVEEEPEACAAKVIELVSQRLPARYGFDPRVDIQTLTPMHKGPLGTRELNVQLQKKLNPHGLSVKRGEVRYTVGDRVMQIRNNYDRGVFNGDIGFVSAVEDGDEICVAFDGTQARYRKRDLDELVHAYCISIHKSQGCEFKVVVIPVHTQHFVMLQRNLIYTALTRARQLCVFVGTLRAFSLAVGNDKAMSRNSALAARIRGDVPDRLSHTDSVH